MPGSGRGAAYAEDVSSTLENTNQWLKDIRENEKLKKKEAQQKANAWNSMLEENPDVWNIDFEKVREKAEVYNNYVIGLKEQGYDPYNLPPSEMKELNKLQSELVRETNAAKANKEWWDKNTFNINEDAGKTWDQGHATEWFKQYADPNLSPVERAKMRQEGNPYLKNVDLVDIVSDLTNKMEEQKLTQGGYDITQKTEEDFKNLVSIYFADQAGMDDYEALMGSGKYKTEDDLINEAVSIFNSLYQPSKVKRGGSGGGGSGSGGTKKEPDVLITGQSKETDPKWDQSYSVNKIALGKTKPVYVYDVNGNPVMNFVPADGFYLKPGGAVAAVGYGTIEEVQLDGTKLAKQIQVEIDYNKNKGNFDAQGYPNIFDEFRTRTSSTSSATGKTFTGVPQGGF